MDYHKNNKINYAFYCFVWNVFTRVVRKMNILVFSEAAWDDKNSFGNTVSNFFCGDIWKEDSFLNFYARNQIPDNKMNVSYYQLSAIEIVKGISHLRIAGKCFSSSDCDNNEKIDFDYEQERRNIDKLHKRKNEFVYFVHEMIWKSGIWINRYFDTFIKENEPDILFAFATSPYILWQLIQYLKKDTKCKIVILIADDTYGNYDKAVWYRKRYLKRELKKCILAADKLYGISDEMSELYQARFEKNVTTLYKGCDLSHGSKEFLNSPLRLVYAGNLLWGRDDILSEIAKTLEKINIDGCKAIMEIYTGTLITTELEQKLNRGYSSQIKGLRPYEDIKRIMHESDVVLHVESFEEETIDTVKYSLSTKIIDCLQSGNQVLGIGPSEIASIKYLKRVKGAIVVDSQENIEIALKNLINNPEQILHRAIETRSYALEKHDINKVQKRLRSELNSLY